MKFKFPYKNFNTRDLIRRCGYGEWFDKSRGVTSYTRKLAGSNYPRFHVYLEEFDNYFEISLHLDQKQPSYGTATAHSGEYDGEMVEDEARRMTEIISDIYVGKN